MNPVIKIYEPNLTMTPTILRNGFIHLHKTDGEWMKKIVKVFWNSKPFGFDQQQSFDHTHLSNS